MRHGEERMSDLSQVLSEQGLQARKAEEQQLLVPGAHCCQACPPCVPTCNHTSAPFSHSSAPLHSSM